MNITKFLIISIFCVFSVFSAERLPLDEFPLHEFLIRRDLYERILKENILAKLNEYFKEQKYLKKQIQSTTNLPNVLVDLTLSYIDLPKNISDLNELSTQEIDNLIKFYNTIVEPGCTIL